MRGSDVNVSVPSSWDLLALEIIPYLVSLELSLEIAFLLMSLEIDLVSSDQHFSVIE